MELFKARKIMLQFNNFEDNIQIDDKGYICLNDMGKFFPNKPIDNWRRLDSTKEIIEEVTKYLNTSEMRDLKSIYAKRGKYGGGTFAHELIAMDFAAWLSVEFKLKVYRNYLAMTSWSFKRYLASEGYKCLTSAVKDYILPQVDDSIKRFQFSNEANLINQIIFQSKEKGLRETATEFQLEMITYLEYREGVLIELGLSFEERKNKLIELYLNKIKDISLKEREITR